MLHIKSKQTQMTTRENEGHEEIIYTNFDCVAHITLD